MNKRRLLKLADLLEADAKNKKGIKFEMMTFGYVTDKTKPLSCGTQACAMGLAALSGAFKRDGLDARIERSGFVSILWNGRKTDGFKAAEYLFDISDPESATLFLPTGGQHDGAGTERAKAKQIRKFVRTGEL